MASLQGYDATRRHIKQSAKELGLEGPIDLYLLHSPSGGRQKRILCWRAVEDAIAEGEVRCGAVINFGVNHVCLRIFNSRTLSSILTRFEQLRALLNLNPKVIPAVNQIELHPFNTQNEIVNFCEEKGIVLQAYSPLVRGERAKHPKISELSEKYGCTCTQLLVRWSLQRGFVLLPKSVKRERIEQNADVGGFEIDEVDMKTLDELDEDLHTDWDPTTCP